MTKIKELNTVRFNLTYDEIFKGSFFNKKSNGLSITSYF